MARRLMGSKRELLRQQKEKANRFRVFDGMRSELTSESVYDPIRQKAINKELLVAARCGDRISCDRAIRRGAEVDARDKHGYTPLMHAAERGYPDIVDMLIQQGANVDAKDFGGFKADTHASVAHHEDISDHLRKLRKERRK